ncbi:MAG: pyruvate kinase [Bacteroidetes bacterium GWC2_33_15]|nr:MAG: pyruvate kinase [Bacteroidetes bacterium GWA2_33_15]OFX49694.1 MAG: pyruvate kinase [Bacteroidetes bacterium GWC2_33_15]OFX65916.1 MAG: pyruvate kinase [Bacteroidetes bacterium GWB2_32_14]OFX68323.1 MAG: pyruvate kinase [Bacteroidetes bacterium GWD2_33_33]HAN18108.1 pyruvate kinase [Bacteroidales bacterium]
MIKKTKIVATISDKTCTPQFIKSLFEHGMDVVRLNTAHQTPEQALKVIQDVRQVSEKIALLIDTKGPEVRTVKTDQVIKVVAGQRIHVKGDPSKESSNECIYVSYPEFVTDVPEDSKILIDDGYVELQVIKKESDYLVCEATNEGDIKGRKSVNVPNVSFNLPSVSSRDKEFIKLATEQDIDFIAHSFVRNKEDILEIQKILDKHKSSIKIIAKIENQQGVDHIDEILDHVYGVMVARGDLAVEIPYEKIPGIQRMLINKCIERRKPVIIATQMLHSMIDNPRPTRAEVNDVASAVYSNTDAVMLSGETANGNYPVEAVCTMAKIALEVEKSKEPFNDIPTVVLNNATTAYLCKSAVKGAIRLNAKAIIADSMSGRTLRALAAYRGSKPIFAQCYSKRTVREMALTYGVIPDYMEQKETSHEFLLEALTSLINKHTFEQDDLIVVAAGNFGRSMGVSYVEIGTVEKLMGHLLL